jgi:hypothetical protein
VGEKAVALAQGRDAWSGAALAPHAFDRLQGDRTADTVDDETAVALEILEGMISEWAEDAINFAAIEPESAEAVLEFSDVVAAHIRSGMQEKTVAKPARCLDEARPGVLAALTVDCKAAGLLECSNGCLGVTTEKARLGNRTREKPGGAEAALQITDGISALTWDQGEVTRNSSSSCSS